MKKSKNIVLMVTPVLSAALLNACGGSSQPRTLVNPAPAATPVSTPLPVSTVAPQTAQTRDVYNNLNDCLKDWGTRELCEQMGEDDDRDYKSKYKTGGGNYFYGPQYSSSNRIITYKGKTITPTGKTSKLPTYVSSMPTSKTTTSTVPTSKTTTGTTSSSSTTTGKTTTSSTSPSSSTSSTSSTSTYTPYSSSSTTRSGFGTTSSSSSYSSSSSSSSSGS